MDVPGATEEPQVEEHDGLDQSADDRRHQTGQDEQMVGRMHQQEPQMPPTVAETRELGLAAATVVHDRELADVEVLLLRPDHHFRRELHAGGAQVQRRQRVTAKSPHAAVSVIDPGVEEDVEQARQQRVADIAVMPRHRAGLDAAHTVADHKISAGLELGEEPRGLGEVVGEVAVGHQNVVTVGNRQPCHVRLPVASARLLHHRGAGVSRNGGTPVVRVVVDDDHLAVDPVVVQHHARTGNALLDRVGLVEAGDQDRKLRCGSWSRSN